jgi:hypothetical protein
MAEALFTHGYNGKMRLVGTNLGMRRGIKKNEGEDESNYVRTSINVTMCPQPNN